MLNPDQLKWDQRYRNTDKPGSPASVLQDNLHLLPAQGSALDLACGLGGNAILLAEQGLEVTAWDISPVAIARLQQASEARRLNIQADARDVVQQPPLTNSFDVIVVGYFLERSLAPAIISALRPNGLLFYQTFNQSRLTGRGPKNPAYRLAENELLTLFAPLTLRFYRDDGQAGNMMQGQRDESLLIAQNC